MLAHAIVIVWMTARFVGGGLARRLGCDERGEGVISTAIAVLVMAFLGALMWVGFRELFVDVQENTRREVEGIGGGGR